LRLNIVFEPKEGLAEKIQCWQIYSLISDLYMPKPEMIRDFLTKPKANGYEALHATFMGPNGKWAEVHIRSNRMHQIAERGLIAYLDYQNNYTKEEGEVDKWLAKVKDLIQTPDQDVQEFLDDFKLNLFSSEILVFTPKGQIKTLPTDSTALDLAYEIHTEIGNKAIAAKVNHKLVPLNQKLNSGDQVEILTGDKNRVSYEWLDFVFTAKAKANIKKILKSEGKNRIRKGKEILEEVIKELKIIPDSQMLKYLTDHFQNHSKDEFYNKLGSGLITVEELKVEMNKTSKSKWVNYWNIQFIKNIPWGKRVKFPQDLNLNKQVVEQEMDEHGTIYSFANCCKPIPGDEVIGHRVEEGKVVIHKTDCSQAIRVMSRFGNAIVPIKWSAHKILSFLVRISLEGVDNFNIYNEITTVISEKFNIKIKSMKLDSSEGIIKGTIDLYIHNTRDLNNLILDLVKIKGVDSVKRVDFND
jgi:GTP diphosphokinase / guanosine-3',5'-bis(diphosphate) 3'-diphosphatase